MAPDRPAHISWLSAQSVLRADSLRFPRMTRIYHIDSMREEKTQCSESEDTFGLEQHKLHARRGATREKPKSTFR